VVAVAAEREETEKTRGSTGELWVSGLVSAAALAGATEAATGEAAAEGASEPEVYPGRVKSVPISGSDQQWQVARLSPAAKEQPQ
jgi:hypothetical protein